MLEKIIYQTIIFQDSIFEEIRRLQNKLSQRDGKIWSISNVINLLLKFYFNDKNNPIYAQKFKFLESEFFRNELFLDEFISNVLMSSTSNNS